MELNYVSFNSLISIYFTFLFSTSLPFQFALPWPCFLLILFHFLAALYIGIPIITIRTNAVSAVKGAQVNLYCDADGYPEPYVAWVKGGIVLQNTTTSKTLHITNIATSQAGIYTCTATNIAGSVSHSIDVTVSTWMEHHLEVVLGKNWSDDFKEDLMDIPSTSPHTEFNCHFID